MCKEIASHRSPVVLCVGEEMRQQRERAPVVCALAWMVVRVVWVEIVV